MRFEITIDDDDIKVRSPEGQVRTMPLNELFLKLGQGDAHSGPLALPPGIKYVRTRGRVTVWVHQTQPQVWNLKWITADSPKPYGGASYRDVVVSLPYLIVVAVFEPGPDGRVGLSGSNECFFRTAPLDRIDTDELLVPGLLNCSLYRDPRASEPLGRDGCPVSWVCTEFLDRARFQGEPDENRRMRLGFEVLMETLLSTGFNYSSEHHELYSGFTANQGVDPRVATVEAWEAATRQDPECSLTIPWLTTGYTLDQVLDRIFKHRGLGLNGARSARDIVRAVTQG